MYNRFHNQIITFAIASLVIFASACSDALTTPSVPDGTQSPSAYLSRAGGLELTKASLKQFRRLLVDVTLQGGLITDELSGYSSEPNFADLRNNPENVFGETGFYERRLYESLHKLRGQAQLTQAILAEYAPDEPALQGQMLAIRALSIVFLADLYCSGVPLSSLDFKGDYTYLPGSTTDELYEKAIVLFDSALNLVSDSADLVTFSKAGKARALLSLGRYDEAASAVSDVKDTDKYMARISWLTAPTNGTHIFGEMATVSDREGINGVPFRSSGDPRTASDLIDIVISPGAPAIQLNFPNKYHPYDSSSFTVASGLEARLIEAEAALNKEQYGVWIQLLNRLRTTGSYSSIDTSPSGEIDTVWNAGSGGIEGLGPLKDPGNRTDRIKLMFSERASWLFLEAMRQGDLRRLVRNYSFDSESVYPTGDFLNGESQTGYYGTDITFPIPSQERRNPLFKGCLNRD